MSTIARLVTPMNPADLVWEADTVPGGVQVVAWYPGDKGEEWADYPEICHALLLPWPVCHELVELLAMRQPERFQAVLRRFAALCIAVGDARKGAL